MTTQPVAVIGAAGFLGTALCRALRDDDIPVAAFTREIPFLARSGAAAPGLTAARTVFWLATSINPAVAEAQPARVAVDREEFRSMLAAVAAQPRPPRVVLLSSGGTVYAPDVPPPYREDAATRPLGAYGRAKLEAEELLRSALPAGQAVAARVANAYGPGQRAASGQGVLAYWMHAVAEGRPITVLGDPATTRDFVHVDDVAGALLAIHRAAGPLPPAINVGSGRATSLRELAELVRDVTGGVQEIEYAPARGFDVPHTWLDISLAARVLGWAPRRDLRRGVSQVWTAMTAPLAR